MLVSIKILCVTMYQFRAFDQAIETSLIQDYWKKNFKYIRFHVFGVNSTLVESPRISCQINSFGTICNLEKGLLTPEMKCFSFIMCNLQIVRNIRKTVCQL